MVTALNAPVSRKRAIRSDAMPALSRKSLHATRLNCEGKGGPERREMLANFAAPADGTCTSPRTRSRFSGVKIEFCSHRQCPIIAHLLCAFALAPERWEQRDRRYLLRLAAPMGQQGNREARIKKAISLSAMSDGLNVEFYTLGVAPTGREPSSPVCLGSL